MGEQIASALAYAHERGVIHRDVKPSDERAEEILVAADEVEELLALLEEPEPEPEASPDPPGRDGPPPGHGRGRGRGR